MLPAFRRKMTLLVTGSVVVAVVACVVLLHGYRPDNAKTRERLTARQDLQQGQLKPEATLPAGQRALVVRPADALSDPELDKAIAEVRDDLYKVLAGEGSAQAIEKNITTRESINARVDAFVSVRGKAGDMMAWVKEASEEEKAWIVAALIGRFDSESDPMIRRACLVCLGNFRQRAPEVLARALGTDVDPGVRIAAAIGLRFMGSEKEVGVLVEAVKKEDGSLAGRNVAQAAITALGAIGGVNAAKALEDIWRDERMSRGCREVTLSALGTAGDPGAMDILENVLAGEQESLRDDAAEGLGEIGKHNSQEPIIVNRVAGSLRAHLWDQNPRVRVSSTYALGWIGGKDDVQLLEGLLEDDYRRIVNYSENGEVMEKETFPVRDKAKEAIDRILARVGAGGDR